MPSILEYRQNKKQVEIYRLVRWKIKMHERRPTNGQLKSLQADKQGR